MISEPKLANAAKFLAQTRDYKAFAVLYMLEQERVRRILDFGFFKPNYLTFIIFV
jgi:hypothetical protein